VRVALACELAPAEREALVAALAARGHTADGDAAAEALVIGGEPLDGQRLAMFPKLARVVRFARGRHDVSGEAALCRERSIAYRSLTGASARSTAEHAVMLMLALLRRLEPALSAAGEGRWPQQQLIGRGLRDLSGARVGLIGMGAVGQATARLLSAFGSTVVYAAPRQLPPRLESELAVGFADLDSLLAQSDIVSLHTRRRGAAEPILDARRLAQLRPDAMVVNTGDGRDIDLAALFERAGRGKLTAALDVFPTEPWDGPRPPAGVMITPHVAGRSRDVARAQFQAVAAALDDPDCAAAAPPLASAGPLLAAAVRRLHPDHPLAGRRAIVELGGEPRLAVLIEALLQLGAAGAKTAPSAGPARVVLHGGPGDIELGLDLARPGEAGAPSVAGLTILSWLADRWRLDFDTWTALLPDGRGGGSLPGRRLTVVGYGDRGRSIAWRAREIGACVAVRDPDPRHQLDALHDGFECAPPGARSDLTVDALDSGSGPPSLADAGDGLIDAVCAAAVLMLAGLAAPGANPRAVARDSDRALSDLLLSDRVGP
jgi:phosphoglycerate dehydrogenase-like enzyme